jgi:adenylate kinase family enzyme
MNEEYLFPNYDHGNIVIIQGRTGTGKTTLAKILSERKRYYVKHLSLLDYTNIKKIKTTLKSTLTGGGILVKIGIELGTSLILDDIHTAPKSSLKLILSQIKVIDNLLIILICDNLKQVSGIRSFIKKTKPTIIKLKKPNQDQLLFMAKKKYFTKIYKLKKINDFREANAIMSDKLVEGYGERDIKHTDKKKIIKNCLEGDVHSASILPEEIVSTYNGTINKLLKKPNDRINYTKNVLAFAKMRNIDSYAIYTAPLSIRKKKICNHNFFKTNTLFYQRKYDSIIKQLE